MSLEHHKGKLWAMREIARKAEAELNAERLEKLKLPTQVIIKWKLVKPIRKSA